MCSTYPCHRHPRDRHSFPTRRSSDLRRTVSGIVPAATAAAIERCSFHASRYGTRPGSCSARSQRRSEEHTSELQSRPHLVCRLLLEKKKTKLESASPSS